MQFRARAERIWLITFVSDVLRLGDEVLTPGKQGITWRFQKYLGYTEYELKKLLEDVRSVEGFQDERFLEDIFIKIAPRWIRQLPSSREYSDFYCNKSYVRRKIQEIDSGDKSGRALEVLSAYLFSCIVGFRVGMRARTPSTDYDVWVAIECDRLDFRAEIGSYFIIECKDWERSFLRHRLHFIPET